MPHLKGLGFCWPQNVFFPPKCLLQKHLHLIPCLIILISPSNLMKLADETFFTFIPLWPLVSPVNRAKKALFSWAGSKAIDYSNGLFDCQSPTSPFLSSLRALHLLEDLRGALELMDADERDSLRCQVSDTTAESLADWLHGRLVSWAWESS